MRKSVFVLAGFVAALAVPAVAFQQGARDGRAREVAAPQRPMTRAEVTAQVRTMFDRFDTNRDGAVTRAEAEAGAGVVRQETEATNRAALDAHWRALDRDASGGVTRAEFDAFHAVPHDEHAGGEGPGARNHPVPGGPHVRVMRVGPGGARMMTPMMFDRLDAARDGRVTLAEATAVPLAMFDRADLNRDGTLSPEERRARREVRTDRPRD